MNNANAPGMCMVTSLWKPIYPLISFDMHHLREFYISNHFYRAPLDLAAFSITLEWVGYQTEIRQSWKTPAVNSTFIDLFH